MTRRVFLVLFALFSLLSGVSARAGVPTDELLPDTTKGYLSVANMSEFRKQWDATQLGQLMADPLMKPFVEDLREQLKTKLGDSGKKIGIDLHDVEGLCDGEFSIAIVQPGGDKKQHALVAIVDVSGKDAEAKTLLEKVQKNQTADGAKRAVVTVGSISLITYVKPKSKAHPEGTFLGHFIHDHTLVSTDHAQLATQLAQRITGERAKSLKSLEAYHAPLAEVAKEAKELQPQVRWFVEPFGYAEVSRAASGGRKKRGTDMLKVLANQGFKAVQGLAGHINLATEHEELLHRTFIYAPKDPAAKGSDKYRLAARMLNFPNSKDLAPEAWVPHGVASHLTMNAKIQDAFEYVATLVDEVAGEPGVFEEVIKSIAVDRNGPQVNLRNDLVKHATGRIHVFSDVRLPITPKSERMAIAFGVVPGTEATVIKAIDKIMQADPNAKLHEIGGHRVWEIINEEMSVEIETLKIEGTEFTSTEGDAADEEEKDEEEEKPVIPNSAVTVIHGHLVWATHLDFIKDVMIPNKPGERLNDAADYVEVQKALARLGADEEAIRSFVRTDHSFHATYELLRQGKMPESETMLAKILNKMLGPEDEDKLREQEIDGSKMPPFEAVRKYLGPGGISVQSVDQGWLVTGLLLTKKTPGEAGVEGAKAE